MRMFPPGPGGRAHTAPWRRWLLPAALTLGFLVLLSLPRGAPAGMPLAYSRFTADVAAGTVRAVKFGPGGQVTGQLTGGRPFTTAIPAVLGSNGLGGQLAAHHVQVTAAAAASLSPLSLVAGLLPLLLIGGLLYLGIRSVRRHAASLGSPGGLTGLGKAQARVIDAERPATRFTDVAGYLAVKAEISEVVDYLRDPARYHRAGARGPRGVLMAGPPGTGKTLLARAVAGEAHVPFLSISGSSFVEMFVGVGAARVRDLFQQARTRAAPTPPNLSPQLAPDTEKNGTFASPATARASSVLPVPGGPTMSTPRGTTAPARAYRSGVRRNSTTSLISAFAPS